MKLSDNLTIHQLTLSDFPASTVIGTAAATVDRFHTFYIPQATGSVALTLPNPTAIADSHQVVVHNTGSVSFTLNGLNVDPNEAAIFHWNGTVWCDVIRSTSGVNVQVFTASGTYTPSSGLKYAIIEMVGGGGGGGGLGAATVAQSNAASGGGSGGYTRAALTAAQVGAGGPVVVGAGGAGGAIGGNGAVGAASSVLSVTANGGSGGLGGAAGATIIRTAGAGGALGSAGVGVNMGLRPGVAGSPATATATIGAGGAGGDSGLGFAPDTSLNAPGSGVSFCLPSVGYGAGGGGGNVCLFATAGQAGNPGTDGIVIITEYL